MTKKQAGPKVLTIDIETSYYEVRTFGIRDQYLQHDQIVPGKDRAILAFTAKRLGENKLIYADTRNKADPRDDKSLVKQIWKLLDEADIVVSKNGKRFDIPIIKARCQIHGLDPWSPFRQIDTETLARRSGYTSTKLDYLSEVLDLKYKKLKHKKFPGRELWDECLAGNKAAWNEMEKYNKHDVLSTEELYEKLAPWGTGINFSVYYEGLENVCSCGSTGWYENGHMYTNGGKFKKYKCKKCGASSKSRENLLTKDKRLSLKGVI